MIPFIKKLFSRTTVQSHLFQTMANLFNKGFGLLFGIVLARLIKPEEFGVFYFVLSSVYLLLLPVSWGVGQILVAKGHDKECRFDQILAFTCLIVLFRLLVVFGLCAWYLAAKDFKMAALSLMIGLPETLVLINDVLRSEQEGSARFHQNLFAAAVSAFAVILVIIPAALAGWGVFAIALRGVIDLVCLFLVYRHFLKRPIRIVFSTKGWRFIGKKGFFLWLINAAQTITEQADKWFIGMHASAHQLGLYVRAFNNASLSHYFLNSFMTNPTVAALARQTERKARIRLLMKSTAMVLSAGIANFALWYWFSDPLVVWIFGVDWAESIPYFQAFAAMSFCRGVFHMPKTLLFSKQQYAFVAIVWMLGALAFVAYLIFWASYDNLIGIAYVFQGIMLVQGLLLWIRCFQVERGPEAQ